LVTVVVVDVASEVGTFSGFDVVVTVVGGTSVVELVDVVELDVLVEVVVEVLVVVGGNVVVVVVGQATPQHGIVGSWNEQVPTAGVVNGSGHTPPGPAGTNLAVGWMTGGVDR
jgi:hypothetical protein